MSCSLIPFWEMVCDTAYFQRWYSRGLTSPEAVLFTEGSCSAWSFKLDLGVGGAEVDVLPNLLLIFISILAIWSCNFSAAEGLGSLEFLSGALSRCRASPPAGAPSRCRASPPAVGGCLKIFLLEGGSKGLEGVSLGVDWGRLVMAPVASPSLCLNSLCLNCRTFSASLILS